jgi:hypothetical protein
MTLLIDIAYTPKGVLNSHAHSEASSERDEQRERASPSVILLLQASGDFACLGDQPRPVLALGFDSGDGEAAMHEQRVGTSKCRSHRTLFERLEGELVQRNR